MIIAATLVSAIAYLLAFVVQRRRPVRAPTRATGNVTSTTVIFASVGKNDYGRLLAMVAAAVVLVASLVGPLDEAADQLLAAHMLQHLLLIGCVAPLVLIAAPLRYLLRALPQRKARYAAAFLQGPIVRLLSTPIVAWVQFVFMMYLTHFSPIYEAALEHPPVHAVLHGIFLFSALIFWGPILTIAPYPHPPSHAVRILMLLTALPITSFVGFAMYVSHHVLYPYYATHGGALADQMQAGAVMWIAGGAPMFVALLWCVADWGKSERRAGIATDRLAIRFSDQVGP